MFINYHTIPGYITLMTRIPTLTGKFRIKGQLKVPEGDRLCFITFWATGDVAKEMFKNLDVGDLIALTGSYSLINNQISLSTNRYQLKKKARRQHEKFEPINEVRLVGRLSTDIDFHGGNKPNGEDDHLWNRLVVPKKNSRDPDYINISFWGGHARAIRDFCQKGTEVLIKGVIKTRHDYVEVVVQELTIGKHPQPTTCTCTGSCA